jgi:hypothetical protein
MTDWGWLAPLVQSIPWSREAQYAAVVLETPIP